MKPYKNDPWFSEKYWLEGFGQLTKIGKQQMFELGAYLRQRYFKLLPENGQYNANDIYVRSTDVDRTLTSAAYALAAMFPPMNEQIWDKTLLWQASEHSWNTIIQRRRKWNSFLFLRIFTFQTLFSSNSHNTKISGLHIKYGQTMSITRTSTQGVH